MQIELLLRLARLYLARRQFLERFVVAMFLHEVQALSSVPCDEGNEHPDHERGRKSIQYSAHRVVTQNKPRDTTDQPQNHEDASQIQVRHRHPSAPARALEFEVVRCAERELERDDEHEHDTDDLVAGAEIVVFGAVGGHADCDAEADDAKEGCEGVQHPVRAHGDKAQ